LRPNGLRAALTGKSGLKPPIKALFVYNCNPVVAVPHQQNVITGLSREDIFTVVSEQFNDRGAFSAFARVTTHVSSGVIVAPMGYWRKFSPSRSTVNVCNPTAFADLGHAPTFSNNMVEVRRLLTPSEA